MFDYLIRRLINAAMVIFAVVTLVFLFIHIIPGDPVEVMLGESARAADRSALRHALGLDLPLWQQWLQYMRGVVSMDLGYSLHSKEAVVAVIVSRLPATISLALASLLLAILLALPLGIMAAVRQHSLWDSAAMTFSMLGVSIPNFCMGPLLIILFSLSLGWLPVSGNATPLSIILPMLTLGTALAALLARMVRSSLLEILQEDYVRAARARGLHEWRVIGLHALKNASLPILTVLGMQLGTLLAGAVITETIFAWPGIGELTIDAVLKRDYPVVQGCVLLISVSYVIVNLGTDLLCVRLDPKIRLCG